MKEIYLLNHGDTIDKIKQQYKLNVDNVNHSKILDMEYICESNTDEDFLIVNNYLPYIEYKLNSSETIMEIMSRGFEVGQVDYNTAQTIILSKPASIRYIVSPLEKLEDIADKFGVDKDYLVRANNLKIDKLFVGQILWI